MFIINNDLTAMEGVKEVSFKFEYDSASGKYGYRDGADTFHPFNDGSGGDFPIADIVGHTVRVVSEWNGNGHNVYGYYDGVVTCSSTVGTYGVYEGTIKAAGDTTKPWKGGYQITGGKYYSNNACHIVINGVTLWSGSGTQYGSVDSGNITIN